ncbi:hypothetical protein ACG92U_06425 [Leuconostoc citreum]
MFSVILARYYDINTKHMQHLFSHNDILSFTNRKEYEVIDLFTNIVALNFDIQITDFIKYFLTLELLSVSKESDAHFNSEAFQDLLLVSTDIVNTFLTMHENYRPEPEELDQLIESVQTQLKPFGLPFTTNQLRIMSICIIIKILKIRCNQPLNRCPNRLFIINYSHSDYFPIKSPS